MKTNIVINLQIEGFHKWDSCSIEEVSFLKERHRHIFHICAKKEVTHDDRQIEIISFKRELIKFLEKKYGRPCEFGTQSCEMISKELVKEFKLNYCSVLEDNENGAEVQL